MYSLHDKQLITFLTVVVILLFCIQSSSSGRIETKVWMTYSEESSSEPTKYKDTIDVGEFDLRKKRNSFENINPFTIRHPTKSEENVKLEETLNRIKSRYSIIKELLENGRDKRSTFDENLDYIQQLLEENDIDADEKIGKEKSKKKDQFDDEDFMKAFREKRSFYHDPYIKNEAYRRLMDGCDSTSSCGNIIKYFNASVESLRQDAGKKIFEAIMAEVLTNLIAVIGIVLMVINVFKIRNICQKHSSKDDLSKNLYRENSAVESSANQIWSLPTTLDDVKPEASYDYDIETIVRNLELKKSKKFTESKLKKPIWRKIVRIFFQKGLFF